MSDEIIKILDDLGQRFGIAIDWSSQNVMPYLQDLVRRFTTYEIATSIMWLTIGMIFLLAGIIFSIKIVKSENRDIHPLILFTVILAVIGIVMIMCEISDIITCCTIPEKMIFGYLNAMLSK